MALRSTSRQFPGVRSRLSRAAVYAALLPLLWSAAVAAGAARAAAVGGAVPSQRLWWPGGSGSGASASVEGHNGTAPGLTASQQAAEAKAAKPFVAPKTTWPSGSGRAVLAGRAARAGSLPVTVAPRGAAAAAASAVTVTVADRAAASRAGVPGVLFSLARSDGRASAAPVAVTVSYAGFAAAYGGGWADRLKLVELPACALTTPQAAACEVRSPVRFTQDLAAQNLTADVTVGGGASGKSAASSAATVMAVASSSSGSVGDYAATPLSPAGTWEAGNNAGSFTYSYPITVPPSEGGGSAPKVALSYDSGSVDGRTAATNAQASWIGDGWDYTPGFVERTYEPCSQDDKETGWTDLCWAGNLVTLSLNGKSYPLVRDDSSQTWKLQSDDGTRVIALTNTGNGVWNGEAWEVVTPDGTKYYFGLDYLPGTTSGTSTQSAWTEPVYCPMASDPCNDASTGTNTWRQMAWRWNLDYVVDPHGNLQTYSWTPETNFYDRGYTQGSKQGTNTQYTRGGYLSSISYGDRLSDAVAGAKAPDVVDFGVAERCDGTDSVCQSGLSASTAANWPDVPFDQICAQSATCTSDLAPSFFSTKRLTSISTEVLAGSGYQPVDTYTLGQMFPSPQAGVVTKPSSADAGDGTVAVMWLQSIQHTGADTLGGGAAVALPAETFTGMMMPNRVGGTNTGYAALYRPRMDYIDTESGAQIVVSYADDQCTTDPAASTVDSNTLNCFPQYWVPSGATGPILDWFNKPQVSEVTVNDLVAPAAWSEAQVTSYKYDGIAWHRDDSPVTPANERTWGQFRGYRTVTTTSGKASDLSVPTQTVTTYLQGMDGDHLANGSTRSVSVADTVGDTVTDSDWLAGKVLETDTLLGDGGAAEKKTVNGPWTYTSTATEARADSMPALAARMPAATTARGVQLTHTGTWRTTTTVTSYDSSGRVGTVDAKGDGTSQVPEVCTTTTYAADTTGDANMLAYPDEARAVQGACGTTATAANTVSDTRTYYDASTTLGTLTGAGDATMTDAVDSYDSTGKPGYVTESKTAYDAYGRTTSATDADGDTTTTAYTAVGAAPDTVTTVNPMGWTSTKTLDPGRGTAIAATDVNKELTTETYDGLGRLTGVWSPLHAKASGAPADKTFAYTVGGVSAPSTVATGTLRDDGSYGTDVKIYDALLRVIQEQAPTADASTGRLITDTHYNSLGQTVKTSAPYANTDSGPAAAVYVAADAVIPSETESVYDGLGRATKSLTVAYATTQWTKSMSYPGTDQTDTTAVPGGTSTSVFTDALGRTSASWTYSTAAPSDRASDASVTTYTYTPAGKQASIVDNAGDTWTYGYDLHGREVSLADPGTGTTTTAYSAGGEILATTDGRGDTLAYKYDKLGRKTDEWDTTGGAAESSGDELASWTYDSIENGQPTASYRYTDGTSDAAHTYSETVRGYTALYQPTGTQVVIPSAEGALAGTYKDFKVYTATTSLLAEDYYYAEGGLPQEQVNYSYTLSGKLLAFGGTYTYLNTASYTAQGQVLSTNFGAYGSQLVRAETYDKSTGRILTETDSLQPLSAPLDATAYAYNQAGSITAESDSQDGVATADTQCFTYDNQNRLTAAWTDTNGYTATANPSTAQVLGIGGCTDGVPTAGKITGGPAPYAETYAYDPLGDRTSETTLNTTTAATAATQTLTYPGSGTAAATQPNSAQTVATTAGGTTTTSTYSYDKGGNTVARTGQSLTYDAEGRTASVTETATSTASTYTYAPDGTLLVQRDQASHQSVVYLPWGEEIHENTGTGAISGLRYYTSSPDGVTVVRSSGGTVDYELTDRLNTATTAVDAATLAVTTRYLDPYGNVRGAAAASWPDQHAYLNRPSDPDTGLDLLGAREYDPVTGRFLSVDQILEMGDQREMNGYAYAADNPVNTSDPTGLSPADPVGVDPCLGPCALGGTVTHPAPPPSGGPGGGSWLNQYPLSTSGGDADTDLGNLLGVAPKPHVTEPGGVRPPEFYTLNIPVGREHVMGGPHPYAYTQQVRATPSTAMNELRRCFNCSFPILNAPHDFPAAGQYIPLNGCVLSGVAIPFCDVPAPVRSYPYADGNGYYFIAQPGHFDAPGSIVSFRFYDDAQGYLYLNVTGYVSSTSVPRIPYLLLAGSNWGQFAQNLGQNIETYQCHGSC